MSILTNKDMIALYRLKTLRSALGLEIKGLKKTGRSAYVIIKAELQLKGNKVRVFEKINEIISEKEKEFTIS